MISRWLDGCHFPLAALFKKTVADERWMEDGGIWFLQRYFRRFRRRVGRIIGWLPSMPFCLQYFWRFLNINVWGSNSRFENPIENKCIQTSKRDSIWWGLCQGQWISLFLFQSFVWDIFLLQWSVLPTWFSKTLHSWPNAELCQNDVSERLLYIVYLFDLFVLHSYLITAHNSHLHGVDYVLVLFLPIALQRCAAGGEASTNTNHSWGVVDNGTPQGRC